jgi:pyruvate dehydrogenase E2 component (dihydrolipoamide acetyltransferase)
MAALFRMPEVAAGTTEALLSEWLVAENTEFSEGDALATVETDKAMVDIEAQTSGIILRYLAEVGERVEVGVGIAVIAEAGESVPDINAAMAELGVGDTTGPTETPATAPTAESVTNATSSVPTTAPQRRFVTPVARRLATERNLDLAAITGTGPHGRIVKTRRREPAQHSCAAGTGGAATGRGPRAHRRFGHPRLHRATAHADT